MLSRKEYLTLHNILYKSMAYIFHQFRVYLRGKKNVISADTILAPFISSDSIPGTNGRREERVEK